MLSYSKPAKKYVSIISFRLSTSQLPWAAFAETSNLHFGQKPKISCSCCTHVEQNMASNGNRNDLYSAFSILIYSNSLYK